MHEKKLNINKSLIVNKPKLKQQLKQIILTLSVSKLNVYGITEKKPL